jgi:hypothetical protein
VRNGLRIERLLNAICRLTGWIWFIYEEDATHEQHIYIGSPIEPFR